MDLSMIANQIITLLSKAFGAALIFLAPIHTTLVSVGFLVLIDLITGVYASYKRNEKITSNGIRRTVTKTLAYMAAIICSHIMEQIFLAGIPISMVRVVGGLIALTEFKSLMENISSLTNLNLWEEILKKFQGQKIIPEQKPTLSIEEFTEEIKPLIKEDAKKPKSKKKPRSKRKN